MLDQAQSKLDQIFVPTGVAMVYLIYSTFLTLLRHILKYNSSATWIRSDKTFSLPKNRIKKISSMMYYM